jgi:hypothetical protein
MRRARGGARARQQRRTGAPARTAPLRTAPVHAARCAPRPRGTRTARQRGPAAARRSCTGVARRGAAARRAARRGAARGARAAPLRAARRCARRRLCSEGSPAARPPGDRGARSRGACGRESAAEIGLWAKWGRGLRRSRMAAEPVLLRAQAPARPPRRTPRHPPRRACCAGPPPPPPPPPPRPPRPRRGGGPPHPPPAAAVAPWLRQPRLPRRSMHTPRATGWRGKVPGWAAAAALGGVGARPRGARPGPLPRHRAVGNGRMANGGRRARPRSRRCGAAAAGGQVLFKAAGQPPTASAQGGWGAARAGQSGQSGAKWLVTPVPG